MSSVPVAALTALAGLALCACVLAPALLTLAVLPPRVGAPDHAARGAASGTLAGGAATTPPPGATPSAAAVARANLGADPLPHGTVVLVRDTPHFWVADERGVLHWAAGTRALVGRYARWGAHLTVTAAELERLPRGEPWLLSPVGFVRGDGAELHVVVWQSGVAWPTLLRAADAEALRPFGVTAEHVSRLAADRRTWERLSEMTVEDLATELTPLSGRTRWTVGQWSGVGTQVSPADTYDVRIAFSEPRVDPELGVVVGTSSYPSFPCSGHLGLVASTVVEGEEEVLLSEWLDAGVENCTIQGRVTLTRRTDRRLFYTWSLPGRSMSVTGLLLRD